MTVTLAQRLLADGVPPSLLIDLLDPEGARLALLAELLEGDVAGAPAPAPAGVRETARTA